MKITDTTDMFAGVVYDAPEPGPQHPQNFAPIPQGKGIQICACAYCKSVDSTRKEYLALPEDEKDALLAKYLDQTAEEHRVSRCKLCGENSPYFEGPFQGFWVLIHAYAVHERRVKRLPKLRLVKQ
jgi:hypothetical protein